MLHFWLLGFYFLHEDRDILKNPKKVQSWWYVQFFALLENINKQMLDGFHQMVQQVHNGFVTNLGKQGHFSRYSLLGM